MEIKKVDIILVEDDPNDADLTIRALRKSGYANSLIHLQDGEEALDFIFCKGVYSGKPVVEMPKLILLDLKMPKVDGIEVVRQLKSDARTKEIPVVLLTSSNQDQDIAKGYEFGVNSYVVKPVDFESLQKAVAGIGMYWLLLNQSPH